MDEPVRDMMTYFGVTAATERFLSSEQRMYVNGEFVATADALEVIEPATGGYLTQIPCGSNDDVDQAVAAARHALDEGPWAQMKPNERERLLLRLAERIESEARTLGEIETLDNGKALGPCIEMDILGGADLLRYMAGFATRLDGATRPVSAPGEHHVWTVKQPIGVVAAIVPWNWPFNMAMWKLAAPLAAGCTIVLKPAQQTSLSMLYFASICNEVGIPPGVINIVTGTGRGIGNYLAGHRGVDKVSFTGSTPVGRRVGQAAGNALSPVTLELGGKSPMIAFADADPVRLAAATRWSVYFNAGQVCSAGSRLYAHRSIYADVLAEIEKVARSMKMAPGLDPDCDMGPVVSQAQQNSICGYIDKGRQEGADVLFGGRAVDGPGFFVEPTLMAVQNNEATVMQEEIFGPVLVAMPFDDDEQALSLANDNIYGLAGSVWTRDVSRALHYSSRLDAGTVWINNHDVIDSAVPFGGFKESGFGKDMGAEQVRHFTRTKAVWLSV